MRAVQELTEVTKGGGFTTGSGVAVLDTSHGQKLLGGKSAHEGGTTWGWDQADKNGAATTSNLAWDGVWLTELAAPVSTADWDDGELGIDHTTADGSGNLAGALDTETYVTVVVTDGNESLEVCFWTGAIFMTSSLSLPLLKKKKKKETNR